MQYPGGLDLEVYFDNAATTRLSESVLRVMENVFLNDYGNPSSLHMAGIKASEHVKEARRIIAAELKCSEKELVFTSGGTESNNLALIGGAYASKRRGKHIITTSFEHASVYRPMFFLEDEGFEVSYVKPDRNGIISPESVAELVRNDTILVSVMAVNNEVGSVQPIEEISKAVKAKNPQTVFHVDAIQAFPKYKILPKKAGIDMMSVSSHKFAGPKGCGFLYIKEKTKVNPQILGGGQQNDMRSGTENVPGIVGMAEAIRIYSEKRSKYVNHMYELKTAFIREVQDLDGVKVNAVFDDRTDLSLEERVKLTAPHVVSVSFPKIKSEVLLHALEMEGIYVSSGSACSSNHPAISGSLKAIGVATEYLDTTLRFSFSPENTLEEVKYCGEKLRELLPVYTEFYRK